MQLIYSATVFAGSMVCLLASILLFIRRKDGKRSRIILAVIVLFSVFNYSTRFFDLINGNIPELVVSAKLLLMANFMILGYIMYPLEVIAPGWLNFGRILRLYSYWILLVVVYLITEWAGMYYAPFGSLLEMLPFAYRFEVLFRLLLSVFIFIPGIIVLFIHRTRLYQNSDFIWVKKYVFTLSLNVLAYLLLILFNDPVYNIVYYYISVGCSLYIVYMELFDRLISRSSSKNLLSTEVSAEGTTLPDATPAEDEHNESENSALTGTKEWILINRLEKHMNTTKAWRNPDLSINTLASELATNRTSLGKALRDCGQENYTQYVNRLRINDFIQLIESGSIKNYLDAFFEAGFRSRSTALRNFRQYTGTIPSDYFGRKGIILEDEE